MANDGIEIKEIQGDEGNIVVVFAVSNNRRNPVGRDGRVTTCNTCGSMIHWMRDCPHDNTTADKLQESENKVHITLMASGITTDRMDDLLGESIGSVVLDSGCSQTVCGLQWLYSFLDTVT